MEIFSKKTNFDFLGRRRIALAISIVLIVISIASLFLRGLNFGIDFTGGTLVEVGYQRLPLQITVLCVVQTVL